LSEDREICRVVKAAVPESVLLELCDERVLFTWELLEQGKQKNNRWFRPLPCLNFSSFKSDARLRSPRFWLFGGLELESAAALLDTTVGGTQARTAAEANTIGAQTYPVDRRELVTLQRLFIACLETVPSLVRQGELFSAWTSLSELVDEVLEPARIAIALNKAKDMSDISKLQNRCRGGLDNFFGQKNTDHTGNQTLIKAVRTVVLDERDQIFAHKYWECASQLGTGGIAVAVVSKHHLPGIQSNWSKTEPNTIKSLLASRDAPAVITATAPFFLAAGLGFGAISILPKLPRRIFFYTALTAPFVGIGFLTQRKTFLYDNLRSFQLSRTSEKC